jgi:hypothetical protein
MPRIVILLVFKAPVAWSHRNLFRTGVIIRLLLMSVVITETDAHFEAHFDCDPFATT